MHRNMGVHISFVKSSVLDTKWSYKQLRLMKCGGNDLLKEYLIKNGGSVMLSKTPMEKYGASVGDMYKEKLEKRALADEKNHPNVLDGVGNEEEEEVEEKDDFFSSWDKPGKSSISSLTPSPAVSERSSPKPSPKPYKSALKAKPANRSILGGGNRKARLGAKKAQDVDFDEFEKEAKAQEEQTKSLGYSVEPEAPAKSTEPIKSAQPFEQKYETPKSNSPSIQRLGFGMVAGSSAPVQPKSVSSAEKYTGQVEGKFGNQRGISSDQFFGRNSYDSEAAQEAKSKLQSFNGASSISSSSYFGEPDQMPQRGAQQGDLEKFVDVAEKYIGEDVTAIKNALEDGVEALSGYLRDYLRN